MNPMNTPTPETDAAEWSAENVPLVVSSDFARRLERERDDLLSRLTAIEHRMPEELARLERERDEARKAIREASSRFDRICWGSDGDCGAADIISTLEEVLLG